MAAFDFLGLISTLYGCHFYSLAQSRPPLPSWLSGKDFFLHVMEYGVLGVLLSWGLAKSGVAKKIVVYVFLIGVSYGITDELHQYFVPERTASLLDLTADGLGSFLGVCSFQMLRWIN